MRFVGLAAAVIATAAAVGCKGSADEDDGLAFVPKSVAFEGKVDPRFAGAWTSADGNSALDLDASGTLAISQKVSAANGKSVSQVKGKWLVSGTDLLFQYAEKLGGETTLKNAAQLSGKTLILKHGSTATTYTRG